MLSMPRGGHIPGAHCFGEGHYNRPRKDTQSFNMAHSDFSPTRTAFLRLANYYRRFIKDFATIAKPLHVLTKKNANFRWTKEAQEAFDQLKQRLTALPVLAHPDFTQPFILDTDASATGIGAVLSQRHSDGMERVISYASRTLSKPNAIIAQLLTSCWPLSYL